MFFSLSIIFFFLSLLSWATKNADMKLADKVHFPVSPALPHTRLRTVQDCLPSITVFLKSWRRREKKRRNFRWSHVRLDSCAAHFRMEQAHLFSCWLPVLKSPEDRSTVRTHAAPSVSYYRVLLSTSLSFILLDKKWQTHFFVHDVFRFICQLVEENLTPGQGADSRGTFGRRKEQLMNGFKWKVLVRA